MYNIRIFWTTVLAHWQNVAISMKIPSKMVLVIIFGKTNVQKIIILHKRVFQHLYEYQVCIGITAVVLRQNEM